MTRLVAFVDVQDRVVVWPSSMSVGFAVNVAVGMAVVFTVSWRVRVSGPAQPMRVAVSVNVVFELIVNARVPPDGVTDTVAPVLLFVMVAFSAFVVVQLRFTVAPGVTQELSDTKESMLNGGLTVTVTVVIAVPPFLYMLELVEL